VLVWDSRKIHFRTREFHTEFHSKNRYRTHRSADSAIRAISISLVKFNVEFPRPPMNLPIESHTLILNSRADWSTRQPEERVFQVVFNAEKAEFNAPDKLDQIQKLALF